MELEAWDLYFDGASNYRGYDVGVLLISPEGEHVPISVKLDFNVTNNAAEYEACLLGMQSAIDLDVKILRVHGRSLLIINQAAGVWKMRIHAKMAEFERYFDQVEYMHLPREENQFADALSKLALLLNIPDHMPRKTRCVERRSIPAYEYEINAIEEVETEP